MNTIELARVWGLKGVLSGRLFDVIVARASLIAELNSTLKLLGKPYVWVEVD